LATAETTIFTSLQESEDPKFQAPVLGPQPRVYPSEGLVVTAALTLLAVVLHGYHPYAEDGGLYLAEIKKLLHPELYPAWSQFVTAQLRFSLFGPIAASLVRVSKLSVMPVMLALHLVSIWATLFAAWQIAGRCYRTREARYGAVSLLALWLTLPIAGTSLMLMDPYVTARSFSTPCGLFALVGAIDAIQSVRSSGVLSWAGAALCLGSLLLAEIVHPLMGTYALGCVVLLICMSLPGLKPRIVAIAGLFLSISAIAALLCWASAPQTAAYTHVAQTRAYWFLSTWQWYELIGLAAPLIVLATLSLPQSSRKGEAARLLAEMAIIAGAMGVAIALIFARQSASSYAVARLQPLRIYQMIYILMILAIGALLGERILKQSAWRWAVMVCMLGGGMGFVQAKTFPDSAHLEFPWRASGNEWERGFAWVRNNTPADATFALDANYISANGEDTQNFRAIAERSALPDYSKDGGVAAIAPELTASWTYGETVQKDLDRASDAERRAILTAASVQWVVLSGSASTSFDCPYMNRAMKVCRVP